VDCQDSRHLPSPISNLFFAATSPSGKARVCKTLIMGSNPIVASEEKDGLRLVFFVFFMALSHNPAKYAGQGSKARSAKPSSWVYPCGALRHPIVASEEKDGLRLVFFVFFMAMSHNPAKYVEQGSKARVCKTIIMGLPLWGTTPSHYLQHVWAL
jgi:hypothetical protein